MKKTQTPQYKSIYRNFTSLMMTAPPVALELDYYKECLESSLQRYMSENPQEEKAAKAVRDKIAEEFTWFEGEKGGGYYKNMNEPYKMVGEELYKFLGIENIEEQQKADELYGTE
jgi:hypothetical protein